MNATHALTLYRVPYTEQTPLWDNDLVNLAAAFPLMEPVLMELQFRRTEMERLAEALAMAEER
jgi:hypothetical protein